MMESTNNNWHLGEIVNLPRTTKPLKTGISTVYEWFIASRYICIREATDDHRGILVKVLGKYPPEDITTVGGHPFCKDERDELFEGKGYSSFPFPAVNDIQKVLEILRSNPSLIQTFEDAKMHVNPKSRFWVSETESRLLVKKKLQCYDANTEQLITPSKNDAPYRLTVVYFYKENLIW